MADLIQIDTDEEMDKYAEAELIAQNPPPVGAVKEKTVNYNPTTGRNDVLTPLSAGGYVKIGDEELPRTEKVKQYSRELESIGVPFDLADYEAAGFTADEVQAAGVMPVTQEKTGRTEPLREGEQLRMMREGSDIVSAYDPTLRENTTNSLREIFVAAGLDNFQARQIAEGILGNPASTRDLGIGVADFTPAGLFFGAQEGYRTFERGVRTGDPVTIGMGALEAGLSLLEAVPMTAAGARAAKAGIPKLRGAIADLGQGAEARVVQPENVAEQGVLETVEPRQVEAPTETKPGIIAFHGSGADFDKFELSKIGTGERAQVFGRGLYFTDSEDIAEFYRQSVRGRQDLSRGYEVSYKGNKVSDLGDTATAEAQPYENAAINKIADNISKVTTMATKDLPQSELVQLAKDKAIKALEGEISRTAERTSGSMFDELSDLIGDSLNEELNALKAIDPNDVSFAEGKKYQVRLDVSPEELLNWDMPFDKQTPTAQRAILNAVDEITLDDAVNLGVDVFDAPYNGDEAAALKAAKQLLLEDFSVNRFLNTLSDIRGSDGAGEELLAKNGLKGITYKADQGPTARDPSAGGPNNYVIFDDKLINIMKKYGITGPVAVSALASQEQEEA